MGRRKIDIQPLTNERNRLVTFQKRKNGLFKKAYELGVLCSVDVAVIIFTPGQNNKLFEFCSANIDDMVLRRLNYEGERDLKTTIDFISGGGQLKGPSSAAAGIAESEDDDDDLSDTKPSKRKASGTRSRPARATTPTTDNLPVYRSDSPQTIVSSAESLPRSSGFSMSERSGALLDRLRSDDHPTASRQGNTILRPGSSASNPDYRRISHFSLLRNGLKSDWPSPRLDNGPHPPNGSLLGSSALLGFDGHHSGHHHQELLSNFARHRANTLAHSGGGPPTGRRLTAPYSASTPPLPPTSLTGGSSGGGNGGGSGGGGGDDSWLDFLAMPSTSMSLNLLADHPTALGGSHASAAGGYDFPFGLGLGAAGRGGSGGGNAGGSGLGVGNYGALSEGADLDRERELLAREAANEFGPRKRPRWE